MGSESKHTPGPWEVVSGDNYMIEAESYPKAYPAKRHYRDDDTGHPLAYVGNREDDYGLANARLIAAAPDLLEALERCEEYFDERADADQPAGCDGPIPNEEMCMQMMVRAALSKATGGMP